MNRLKKLVVQRLEDVYYNVVFENILLLLWTLLEMPNRYRYYATHKNCVLYLRRICPTRVFPLVC